MKKQVSMSTCDRCGCAETFNRPEKEWRWGQFAYREINGGKWGGWKPGGGNHRLDLCPSCLGELHYWFTTLPKGHCS